ncbi:MAG: cytochrome c [Polyangiales bacterium]
MTRTSLSIGSLALVAGALAALLGCGSDTPAAGGVSAARGQSLVASNVCGSCHQSSNAADGILSGQTSPRPGTMAYGVNLTPDNDTGIGSWTTAQIVTAIRTGVDDEGESLCSTMPRYATMSDDDAASIAAYLKSIPAVHREVPESMCSGDAGADAAAPDAAADARADAAADGRAD